MRRRPRRSVKMQPVTMLERCLAYPMLRMLLIGWRIAHPQLAKLWVPPAAVRGLVALPTSTCYTAAMLRRSCFAGFYMAIAS